MGEPSTENQPGSENIQNRHVIVELGFGEMPLPLKAPSGKFTKQTYYIGLELPKEMQDSLYYSKFLGSANRGLPFSRRKVKEMSLEERQNIELVAGDILNKQPITDKSADEVFIANVLTDPHFRRGRGWYDFKGLFEEVSRILKPNGRLVVYTSYVPFDNARIQNLLKDNGYEIQAEYSANNPDDLKFVQEYDMNANGPEHLLIAVKQHSSD